MQRRQFLMSSAIVVVQDPGLGGLRRLLTRSELDTIRRGPIPATQAIVEARVSYRADAASIMVWESPAKTWSSRIGECADIALLKFALLRIGGVPSSRIRFVYGRADGVAHAFVAADGRELDSIRGPHSFDLYAYTEGARSVYETPRWSRAARAAWLELVDKAIRPMA